MGILAPIDGGCVRDGVVRVNRRRWLRCVGATIVIEAAGSAVARAADKLSKGAVSYEDHSSVGKACSGCAHYLPAAEPSKPGQCQIVADDVGPLGHCILWTERNPSDSC